MTTAPSPTQTALGPLRQIEAGLLDVRYVDAGPADGPAVLLLHGWPYDIHSYAGVTPLLTAKGYRVIVPRPAAISTGRGRRCRLRKPVLRPVDAPHPRRHRPQRAAGGPRGVRDAVLEVDTY